jgi:predicted XRE-type DNA-binding protein
LFLGTNVDNVADRVSKGRSGYRAMHGEENGASKLTNTQIRQIRGMYKFANFSQSQLARIFAVQQSQVSRIVNGVRGGGVL